MTDRVEILREFEEMPLSATVNEQVAAMVLDVRQTTLRRWRFLRTNLPFVKIGAKVAYRKSDILSFVSGHTVRVEPTL